MAYITNRNTYSVVYGTASDDTIYNSDISHYSTLDGGAGNDSIYTYQGNQLTIRGGTGNDTIRINSLYSNRHVIQYSEGDGNDLIQGFKSDSTLSLESGSYTSMISGWKN